jgi:predicted PurR-regulated permease PerM
VSAATEPRVGTTTEDRFREDPPELAPASVPSAIAKLPAKLSTSSQTPQPTGVRWGIAVLACAAAVALLYYGQMFFITVITAVIIAFLLDPVVSFFMRVGLSRGVASFVVCSLAVSLLYVGGVALVTELSGLTEELPQYSDRISKLIDQAIARVDEMEKASVAVLLPSRLRPEAQAEINAANAKNRRGTNKKPDPPTVQEVRIQKEATPIYQFAYEYLRSIYPALLMASFVPFLVYFMLSWRDHLRVRFLSLFEGGAREGAARGWQKIADVARAYVLGNFFLGLIVGIASGIFFASVNIPYWPLIGPVSGFLSLVPYLGLPLAILPPLVAALPVHTDPAMYLFIASVVAILHLLALNLIYPKIVGSRVHLNPLAVTLALMFWGTMWGGVGLLFAVPITAGIKAVCDSVESLAPLGKLLGD